MNTDSKLLTKLVLKTDEEITGIVDYVDKKQIYFFDFTRETSIDYLLLAILWKGNKPNIRFSVYCTLYANIRLPVAKLIPKTNIKSSNHPLEQTIPTKHRRTRLS